MKENSIKTWPLSQSSRINLNKTILYTVKDSMYPAESLRMKNIATRLGIHAAKTKPALSGPDED